MSVPIGYCHTVTAGGFAGPWANKVFGAPTFQEYF